MSSTEVARLVEKCSEDPEFRAELRNARRKFVEDAGFTLDDKEWAVFDEIDWTLSDEELLHRYGPLRIT